jgi:hypothetical protein
MTEEILVSVRFLEPVEMDIQGPDGKFQRRSFKKDQVVDVPKSVGLRLFKEGKILPGPEHGKSIPF